MGTYLMMLYVSLEQETAVKDLFSTKGWGFKKPDLSMTTDKLGPLTVEDADISDHTVGGGELGKRVAKSAPVTRRSAISREIKQSPAPSSSKKSSSVKVQLKKTSKKSSENAEFQEILEEAEIIAASITETEDGMDMEDGAPARVKLEHDSSGDDSDDNVYGGDGEYDEEDQEMDEDLETENQSTSYIDAEAEDETTDMSQTSSTATTPRPAKKRKVAKKAKPPSTPLDAGTGGDAPKLHVPTKDKGCRNLRLYDAEQFSKAYHAVSVDKMSVRKASKVFGVPETTIRDRLHGRISFKEGSLPKSGSSPVLDEIEEQDFVDSLLQLQTVGYEHSVKEVAKFATDMAVALGKKSASESTLTRAWYSGFLQRNPKFKIGRNAAPRKLSTVRIKATSREITDTYYAALSDVLVQTNLLEKPECIYIVEEVPFAFELTPESVYCGSDITETGGDAEDQFTMIASGNASGGLVPPFFVLPGKRWNEDYLKDTCPGSSGNCSELGICNADVLRNYFDRHFKKFVPLGVESKPKLILYDGYKSLLQLLFKSWAEENNIFFFVVPPHASSFPELNTVCFNAVNSMYTRECQAFLRKQSKCRVTNQEACRIASKAYLKAMTPSALSVWFSKNGVYPFRKVIFEGNSDSASVTPVDIVIQSKLE